MRRKDLLSEGTICFRMISFMDVLRLQFFKDRFYYLLKYGLFGRWIIEMWGWIMNSCFSCEWLASQHESIPFLFSVFSMELGRISWREMCSAHYPYDQSRPHNPTHNYSCHGTTKSPGTDGQWWLLIRSLTLVCLSLSLSIPLSIPLFFLR